MFAPHPELSDCRILLSNDDGIVAPELKILEGGARQLRQELRSVAPVREQSDGDHSLILYQPLRPTYLAEELYSVDLRQRETALALKEVLE